MILVDTSVWVDDFRGASREIIAHIHKLLHGLGIGMAGTAAGDAVSRVMALFAQVFGALY
jgi:hypothetical protein